MKKQTVVALALLLLIPVVTMLGGLLFSLINPESAAGHLPQPCEDHDIVGIGRGRSDLVAARVPSGNSVQGAILVVALFRKSWGPSGSPFWRC